ncbi:MAG TPA: ABC transporter permease subunit [Pyrinomonadaceae bacterium]|jgi:oligopeptide transport system permease protein|nr:ABC transporter permease subunit [Pyrinomonadaceae bacterium]
MLGFILRRLLIIIPMAWLVVTLTWGLIRIAPGNFYSGEKKLPAAVEANIRAKYGLDKPWYTQYGIMIWNVIRGDFGYSLKNPDRTVNEMIADHLPYSATVGFLAYLLALILGIAAGTVAALKQNSAFDYASMSVAMFGLSLPNFVLGPLFVLVFSLWLYVFPPARWGGPAALVMPVITLGVIYAAYIARLTRAGMLEILRSDYIRTARAKGLDEKTILLRHALRGGLIPVVSFTGPALAALLGGTVVVEKVFALPGLGNIFIQAVLNRDETLVLGIVAFLSILIMIFNLVVDISYGFLDPRIRYE